MTRVERWLREAAFLKTHVYYDMHNLNDGFDVEDRAYFNESQFAIVLERCRTMGILVDSIEPWKDGKCFAEISMADSLRGADDPEWYFDVFLDFVAQDEELMYRAAYTVPIKLLEMEHYPSNPHYIYLNTFREEKERCTCKSCK